MLFGSNLLEVAIGIIFVYLLLSLLCSAFSELIEAFIKFRARDLKKGIGRLLDNPKLVNDLFNHPLISPLGENPSYIPARTFSLALWSLAITEAAKAKDRRGRVTQVLSSAPPHTASRGTLERYSLDVIRGLITSLDEDGYRNIQTSLLALIDQAGNDINKASE